MLAWLDFLAAIHSIILDYDQIVIYFQLWL